MLKMITDNFPKRGHGTPRQIGLHVLLWPNGPNEFNRSSPTHLIAFIAFQKTK